MSSRLSSILRLRSHLLHRIPVTTTATALFHNSTIPKPIILTSLSDLHSLSTLRFFSTSRRHSPTRPKPVDIGARARQLQNRRLWTYALTFSCIAGFIVIVLNNFQDQLVNDVVSYLCKRRHFDPYRNGTPGTEPGRSGRNLPGFSGTGRDSSRDKNVAVLSRIRHWDGAFRPERGGINNFGTYQEQIRIRIVTPDGNPHLTAWACPRSKNCASLV